MTDEAQANKRYPTWRVPLDTLLSLKPVSAFLRHVMHRFDTPLMRATGGRFNLTMGLPSILMTTTGRKTGARRSSPLLYVNIGEDIAIIGTRFGANTHPGWYYNLGANSRATVTKDGEVYEVEARPATEVERETIWAEADRIYIGFAKYRERITEREVPMFVLKRV